MKKNPFKYNHHKALQKLFDDYKNKSVNQNFHKRLGTIMYDFAHYDKDQPLYKWIYEGNVENRFEVLHNLVHGKFFK
tara:strand:+ start:5 stop:235 length:231 start_codon:yes stop_codon:yes gene_type:complete